MAAAAAQAGDGSGEEPYPDGVPFVKWTGDMDAMPPPPWVARNEQGRLVYVPLFGMTTYVQPPAASADGGAA